MLTHGAHAGLHRPCRLYCTPHVPFTLHFEPLVGTNNIRTTAQMTNNTELELLLMADVTYVTLKRGRDLGISANSCIAICLMIKSALSHYEIGSHLEAVTVEIQANSNSVRYGPANGCWYVGEKFLGHSVAVIPSLHTLVDPTIQQFSEVRNADSSGAPVIARIPWLVTNLGNDSISINMKCYEVSYVPNPGNRDAWRPILDHVAAMRFYDSVGLHGEDVALEALERMRQREVVTDFPHPRIRQLIAALDGTEFAEDEAIGPCFRNKAGAKLRLRDIPR